MSVHKVFIANHLTNTARTFSPRYAHCPQGVPFTEHGGPSPAAAHPTPGGQGAYGMVRMHVLPPRRNPQWPRPGREDSMKQLLTTLWQDESGQDLAEYALLLALIAVLLVAAIAGLRTAIGTRFNDASDVLNTA